LSNLLRADAVAVLEHRPTAHPASVPRLFGTRLLRGDNVGMLKPVPLAAPLTGAPIGPESTFGEPERAPAAPPAELAALEEAARAQGYIVGLEEGRAAGIAAAEEAMGRSVQQLSELVNAIHENHASFFRSAERQVVDLALQIAAKVVEREVENMPDMAINIIRAALEEMDARTAVRVRVNPADEELLRRRWSQVVPAGIGADRIELQQDERVQSGGAVIETTHGQVDAQLESKLAQLGNALWTFVMDVSAAQDKDGADA
jgi:flagellar biosynthesis/type III secretory pathway protein FliH